MKGLLISLLIICLNQVYAEDVTTRFGVLKIDTDHRMLYKGKELNPKIQGNNSLSIIGIYKLESSDVVLIQDNGGTACPALYHFVELSANGIQSTKAFGSCSDLIEVKKGTDYILVSAQGFSGPNEPEESHIKSMKRKEVFIYKEELHEYLLDEDIPAWYVVTGKPNVVLRLGPSTKDEKIGNIPYGTRIKAIGIDPKYSESLGKMDGEWLKVKWNDQYGYVFSGFLKFVEKDPSFSMNEHVSNKMVKVPDITSDCKKDPIEILVNSGLRPIQIWVHGPGDVGAANLGCPYNQEPAAGTLVKKGSMVIFRSWWEAG